jgi:hypothetical protein
VLVVGVLVSALLVVVVYAPYWEGRASLPFLDRGNWFTASPPTLLRELLRRWQDFEAAGRTAAMLSAAAFGACALVLLGRLVVADGGWRSDRSDRPTSSSVAEGGWRSNRSDRPTSSSAAEGGAPEGAFIRTGYHLFFAYLVLACLWWQPWYLLVLLVFAALSGDQDLADRANLFWVGGLLSYPVFKYIWVVHQVDWQLDYFKIMLISVVVIFTLPLIHLVLSQVGRKPNA